MKIPSIGLGTFRLKGAEVINSVSTGLDVGYRHIDTAQIYDNEADVGVAILQSAVLRSELFVTTKIWTDNLSAEKLIPSLRVSLQKLQTEAVDLTLIHWPSPKQAVPLAQTLEALMKAKQDGLTKEIGISNFPISEMKKAIEIVGAKNIFTNQIEVHPYLQNRKLLEFSKEQGIRVTAYMPLAYGRVVKDEKLIAIGKKYDLSAADVSLSWLLDQDLIVIPSSTKKENLQRNLHTPKNILTLEDLAVIRSLEDGGRLANPGFAPQWD